MWLQTGGNPDLLKHQWSLAGDIDIILVKEQLTSLIISLVVMATFLKPLEVIAVCVMRTIGITHELVVNRDG